ncbi:MAG: OsmC family protein [Acidimicrobiales bacterium]|nr:OsmC family protein [Acidimicrobiales bacterium]MCB9395676.1 OsmC family protein [Acidimicrobiaceae bacterium]
MADEDYEVAVSAGSLRSAAGIPMPHRWTPDGVVVEAPFTGAHLLHLAVAGCVLNDVHREAEHLGIVLHGVRVVARGGFDATTWRSTGVSYEVQVASDASDDVIAALIEVVDEIAEIPKALRAGTSVVRRLPG